MKEDPENRAFPSMANMKSDTPLDYAVFQLSPRRSRCELFVFSDGSSEKLASGLLKPFVAHLRIAEQQLACASQSVKLEIGRRTRNAETWFTKGTLERFVRFVSTPEVLELVNTFDAEMSQLEAARKIYSQGAGDQPSGGGVTGVTAAEDATKKELLRAIDVRLVAVQQDLSTACARAAAAGFNIDTVSELQKFADRFGAHRLNEACSKFITLSERRPELINPWKSVTEDRAVRASYGSDMSIDDDPPSPPCQRESSTCQQPNPPPLVSRESSVERDQGETTNAAVPGKESKDESSTPNQAVSSVVSSQPGRRLSVQDRINMFESKQKETSGGKPGGVKQTEVRRLSSDLPASGAAAEKTTVLRRWSGASDMSIDLSADKKDNESPSCTPSSAATPQDKRALNLNDESAEDSSVSKPDIKIIPSLSRIGHSRLRGVSVDDCGQFFESTNSNSVDIMTERSGEGLSGPQTQAAGVKEQVSSHTQSKAFVGKGGEKSHIPNQREDSESKDESGKQARFKANQNIVVESGIIQGIAGSRIREAFASHYRKIEVDSTSALPSDCETEATEMKESRLSNKVSNTPASNLEVRAAGKAEVSGTKESRLSGKASDTSVSSFEDSGPHKPKFNRQGLTADPNKKAQVPRDESSFIGNSRKQHYGKVLNEAQEGFDSFTTPPTEQAQRARQKGNQELNNELKMKASELEKLFAEHKLRGPGDHPNSSNKDRSGDTQREPSSSLQHVKPVADISPQFTDGYQSAELTRFSKNSTNLTATSPMKTNDSQHYGDAINEKFTELSVSEGSRGKLYDSYMQKRDAKLRKEWSSNRAEKEAKLKFMQDSLERSRSEMKDKISGSAHRQSAVSNPHLRAERPRSYNSRSIMKREQQHIDFRDTEGDEERLDFPEQKRFHENRALDDTSVMNGVSRIAQGKKHRRSLSSYTPLTSAAPVPRSATKSSINNSVKQRMQTENPLAQSVQNVSDLRKENTKPSSQASKMIRSQVKNYAHSKSIKDEAAIVKEDKSRRLHSLRNSSANPSDFREIFPVDSDGLGLTPIKFGEEAVQNVGMKPFLKKGSRTSYIAQTNVERQKASVGSELINKEEETDDIESGTNDFVSMACMGKHEGDGELENLDAGNPKNYNSEVAKEGLELEKFVNSGSENGDDDTIMFSRVDLALGSQLPSISSSFLPEESMLDWAEESPVSWNPCSHDIPDVDAFVDSSLGSPASRNSDSLNQMEADASGRKKWGTAQKPILLSHSSNNSSRKDMSNGFKRLLKFGRKSRGSESLADWISVTTSEGDDDTEDGKDPSANRLCEDLRKSRMGFPRTLPSGDSFSESEFFNGSVQSSENSFPAPPANFKLREDQISGSSLKAPRSFFSLSTFRSKGSDSRPR